MEIKTNNNIITKTNHNKEIKPSFWQKAAGIALATCIVAVPIIGMIYARSSSAQEELLSSLTSLIPASVSQEMTSYAPLMLSAAYQAASSYYPVIPSITTGLETANFFLNKDMDQLDLELPQLPSGFEHTKNSAQHLLQALSQSKEEDFSIADTFPIPANDSILQCFSIKEAENDLKKSIKLVRKELALREQGLTKYGNKHRNLVQMERIDAALNIQDLEIPAPRGIASEDVVSFLKKNEPDVFVHWKALKDLHSKYKRNLPFVETSEAASLLTLIETGIDRAFSKNALKELNAPIEWLKEREKAKDFLMVRSTGAEDSHKMANAGGNLSRSYVKASPKEFMEAVGSVVKSYFGKNSLQNRLNGGTNPFEEELKLAVTTQLLIGEPVGGALTTSEIPVSFVLFTNEPLYIGEEKFRMMRLSASYGHGEGVVGNLGIATDTALLLQSESHPDKLYMLYDNQKKTERLVPLQKDQNVVLGKIPNPGSLTSKPALSHKDLAKIYHSGVVMESFYNEHPTDIEGVVKNGKVYFVQARPVNRKPLLPTYLKSEQGVVEKLQTEILVPGKASVVTNTKKEEILVASTLAEAEKLFSSGDYKLVIVSQPEPQNSHPVVNFSSLGVPCLYTPNQMAVEKLLDRIDEGHTLATCMQTGSLNLWDNSKGNLKDQIKEGFAVHPAKIAISLPVESRASLNHSVETKEKLTSLLRELQSSSSPEAGLATIGQITKEMKGLKTDITEIEQSIQKAKHIPREVTLKLKLLKELDKKIDETLEEAGAILASPAKRLQTLFHFKALNTILTGSNHGIGQYSLLDAGTEIRSIHLALEYQNNFPHEVHCLSELLAGAKAVSSEAFNTWQSFIKEVEILVQNKKISSKELKSFQEIVTTLEKTNALTNWITLLPKTSEPAALFKKITAEISVTDQQLIMDLTKDHNQIEQMNNLISRFSDPKTHPEAWKELTGLTSRLSSDKWLDQIKAASPTTRFIAYKIMHETLDLLDTSLKTVKASSKFDLNEKGSIFKKMLLPYFQIMKKWATLVPAERITHHTDWPLNLYMDKVQRTLNTLNDQGSNSLLPSRSFSVSASILSAGTEFSRHIPQTLEDMLTLLHQNSLSWISSLNLELVTAKSIEQSSIPSGLKKAIQKLETKYFDVQIQRVGMDIEKEKITFHYNVPLRNHSGQIDLIYNTRTDKFTFQGLLLGPARQRWEQISRWIQVLEDGVFPLSRPLVIGEQELKFSWDVSSENLISAFTEYSDIARYSLQGYSYYVAINTFLDRWRDSAEINLMIDAIVKSQDPNMAPFYAWILRNKITEPEWIKETGQIFNSASTVAKKGMKSTDSEISEASVKLYQILFERGQAFDAGIQAAQEGLKSSNWSVRREALNLFQSLFEREKAFGAANKAAQEGMKSADWLHKVNALKLFQKLAKKGKAFDVAVIAAQEGLKSPNHLLKKTAQKLYEILVKRGQAK